jgi:glycosyltransferase involved in cell wall biosynthesis
MQNVNAQQCQQNKNKVLLIIPAYNEAENLPGVVEDILSQKQEMDYVIVSDGSTDGTLELCRKQQYNYIALPINLGLAGCFQAGMKYAYRAGYTYAVQFDGDGQHRAEDVATLRARMDEGNYDIVLGSRFLRQKKGGSMREIGSRMISAAIRLTTGKKVTDPTCGLRIYNRRVIASFAYRLNYGPEPDTISYLIKNGAHIAEAPVSIHERQAGESYLRPMNAIRYMLRMLVSILFIQNFRHE